MKRVIAMTICTAMLLSGCSLYTEVPKIYDAGEYRLASVSCSGDEMALKEVYPEGGELRLSNDGTGLLRLGKDECEISWSEDAQRFILSFAGVSAEGAPDVGSGILRLKMGDTGLELMFSKGDYVLPEDHVAPAAPVQLLWNGERSGRMWYEETDGEWSDYFGRSTAVTASTEIDSDGDGSVLIYSPAYSSSVPMARLNVTKADEAGNCRITSGYFMDLNLAGWHDAELIIKTCLRSELRSTEIITFNGQYGHFFSAEDSENGDNAAETADEAVTVMRLTGRYESVTGGFSFIIELT